MAVAVKDEWVDIPSPNENWVDMPAPKDEWVDVPEPAKERGIVGETGAALARGALNVGAGFTGTAATIFGAPPEQIRQVGTPWGPMPTAEQQTRLKETLQTATEKIQTAVEKFPRTIQGPGGWALNVVGEAIPYMGAALAGGYIAGPIGAATVGFSVEGQNAYDAAIKSGATEDQANTERVVVGSLNAAIEALQIGQLMKFQKTGKHSVVAFKELVKKRAYKQLAKTGGQFTKDVLKNAVTEGTEEFLQEGVSVSVPAIFRGEYPKTIDGKPDVWAIGERLGAAALGGAVAGGVLGAGGAVTLAAPEVAAPSVSRIETLAEKIQTDPKLGEVEKAQLVVALRDILPTEHPAKRETRFGPDVVQVWKGKESGKIYPETKMGGLTRMEEVPVEIEAVRPTVEEQTAQVTQKTTVKDEPPKIIKTGFPEKEYTFTGRWFTEEQGAYKTARNKRTVDLPIYRSQDGNEILYMPEIRYPSKKEIANRQSQVPLAPSAPVQPETRTRVVSTETGEELELDKDLTAQAHKEARPPTIFDIPEATQKTLDAAKKVGDILLEFEPMRGEFRERMEARKYSVWNRAEDLVKKYAPEFGNIVARKRAMGEAKGLLREEMPGVKERLTADEQESLQRAINESTWYNPGEKMNLSETLHELFDFGVQPDRSSIRLFDKFFGTNILERVKRTAPKKWWKKIGWYAKEGLLEGLGGFKQLATSFDFSAGGVQAAPNLFRHPIQWLTGAGVGYRAALSNRYTRFLEVEMKSDPDYRRIVEDGGLPITKVGNLESGEEMFRRGSWVQKIPLFGKGVAGSERAYVANLNYQRFAVAKKTLESWDGEEQSYTKDRELMDHIGNLTGRGKGKPGGWFEKHMEVWSAGFWAPRLYKAVIDLPIDFIRLPHIRKIAAHDAVQAFILMGLTTWLASLIPGVERDDDPTSTDFWKLKHGNTRYNPLGRYQQLIRLVAQMTTGKVKSSTTGRSYEKDRTDILTRYLRGKLGPGPGMGVDIATGETFKGEPLEWNEEKVLTYIGEHVTPLFAQDLADAIRFQGLDSSTPFTVALGAHGISTQTYEVTPTQETMQYKNQLAHEYFGTDWDQLGEEAQKALREARPSIADYERAAKFESEDVTYRGVIAQEALNVGNRVQRKLPHKAQAELERLQIRIGELKRYSGNGWYLNQERYKQFQTELEKVLQTPINKIIESENWSTLAPDIQRDTLETLIRDAKKYVWQKVKNQANAEDFVRREGIINERETTVAQK